jgi:hypothetical protein
MTPLQPQGARGAAARRHPSRRLLHSEGRRRRARRPRRCPNADPAVGRPGPGHGRPTPPPSCRRRPLVPYDRVTHVSPGGAGSGRRGRGSRRLTAANAGPARPRHAAPPPQRSATAVRRPRRRRPWGSHGFAASPSGSVPSGYQKKKIDSAGTQYVAIAWPMKNHEITYFHNKENSYVYRYGTRIIHLVLMCSRRDLLSPSVLILFFFSFLCFLFLFPFSITYSQRSQSLKFSIFYSVTQIQFQI